MNDARTRITLTDEQRKQLARILAADEPVEISRPDEDTIRIWSTSTYDSLWVYFTCPTDTEKT